MNGYFERSEKSDFIDIDANNENKISPFGRNDSSVRHEPQRSRTMRFFGIVSYEFYDFHILVCIIHTMTSAELIKKLRKAGWKLDRVRGSHHIFTHAERPGSVVIPHPKKDLGKGLIRAILKQAGI